MRRDWADAVPSFFRVRDSKRPASRPYFSVVFWGSFSCVAWRGWSRFLCDDDVDDDDVVDDDDDVINEVMDEVMVMDGMCLVEPRCGTEVHEWTDVMAAANIA